MIKVINCSTGKKEKINEKDFYEIYGDTEFYKDKFPYKHAENEDIYYANKEEFDKLFVCSNDLRIDLICNKLIGFDWNWYILKEEYDKIIEELKKPHKPFVIKGEKEPYYFKVGDKIFYSKTKNWYKFVVDTFYSSIAPEWCLEELVEEDELVDF